MFSAVSGAKCSFVYRGRQNNNEKTEAAPEAALNTHIHSHI